MVFFKNKVFNIKGVVAWLNVFVKMKRLVVKYRINPLNFVKKLDFHDFETYIVQGGCETIHILKEFIEI